MHTKFGLRNLKGRHYSEDLGVYEMIILMWILAKQAVRVRNVYIWHRIHTISGVL